MNEAKQFQKWLNFLFVFNHTPQNKEALIEYFFLEFAENPDMLCKFIEYIKRKLKRASVKDRKIIARGYLSIMSPICGRFGLFHEKDKLDDVTFKIVDKRSYEHIDKILKTYKEQSKDIINKISYILKKTLDESGYKYSIKGRYKNIRSVQRKLKKGPRRTVLTLKDIFAFRIILENNKDEECFEVLNLLHDHFFPIVDHFKDYITIPKINGYQSLHTGLTGIVKDFDLPVEVQIRTQIMDDFAENGVAAHWIYAKNKQSKLINEKEKMLIEYMSSMSKHKIIDEVYFFSYDGNVFHLEEGATVLDFAYLIHTDLGNKMKYALVNGKKKNLEYKIQNGDKIKIVVGRKKLVTKEWLEFAHNKLTQKRIHEST